ncbi:MAG TPA: flagellar motor switch phosphatase FliY [Bacilli bacterium]|nr:flagellar motor switch phosphatase FliY [Bacilli bacterium]
MNDGMLSQDEIDALLNLDDDTEEEVIDQPQEEQPVLTEIEQDALGEIGNISFGSSATTLATLLNQKVEITTPTVTFVKRNELEKEFPVPHVGVEVKYTEGFKADNLFILKSDDAYVIADLMLGGDGQGHNQEIELDDIYMSAIQEAMNQMMGTAATSMSTIFSKRVDISPPETVMLDVSEDLSDQYIPNDDILIKVSFQLIIGDLVDSNIMQLLPPSFAKEMVDGLLNAPEPEPEPTPEPQAEVKHEEKEVKSMSQQTVEREMVSTPPRQPRNIGEPTQANATIQNAQFSSFEQFDLPQTEQRNLDMLLDIPLQVTVELGRTKRAVQDILELSSGSILELDKLAGEPVDIHVNNKLIAQGEVVVIDENFGVRVTEIISQTDRLKNLK